nr:hypothetical protein [uncultured Tolumonas sp.]
MSKFTIESDIEQLKNLTAALDAAVSISDIEQAVIISHQREMLLKKLSLKVDLDMATKKILSVLCLQILNEEKPLMDKINTQKEEIESKLKNQVNSNKAMSQYQQHR